MKLSDPDEFIKLDVKKIQQVEDERKRLLSAAMQHSPELHYMRCPRCSKG